MNFTEVLTRNITNLSCYEVHIINSVRFINLKLFTNNVSIKQGESKVHTINTSQKSILVGCIHINPINFLMDKDIHIKLGTTF